LFREEQLNTARSRIMTPIRERMETNVGMDIEGVTVSEHQEWLVPEVGSKSVAESTRSYNDSK
jgi:hypothetical protein